jgi:hypothetical protein
MMNEQIRLYHQFNNSPNLCNLLQLISFEIWQRVKFGRTKVGYKVFETTITQNVIFEIYSYSQYHPNIPIKVYEAINEPANGNDIELIIQTRNGYIIAPLQAKIIYKTNNYPSMDHGNQINDLISYANRIGGIPLYLLYNFFSDPKFVIKHTKCNVKYGKEQFGCSLVNANYLLNNFAFKKKNKNGDTKWIIPKFIDLHHSIALPWFILGCCCDSSNENLNMASLIETLMKPIDYEEEKVKTYKLHELIKNDMWKPFEINEPNFKEPIYEMAYTKYIPRYRIVLGSENI